MPSGRQSDDCNFTPKAPSKWRCPKRCSVPYRYGRKQRQSSGNGRMHLSSCMEASTAWPNPAKLRHVLIFPERIEVNDACVHTRTVFFEEDQTGGYLSAKTQTPCSLGSLLVFLQPPCMGCLASSRLSFIGPADRWTWPLGLCPLPPANLIPLGRLTTKRTNHGATSLAWLNTANVAVWILCECTEPLPTRAHARGPIEKWTLGR
jgi:hypothetical protein